MAIKIVQTINKISPTISVASTSSGLPLKSGYIRVSTGSTGAYVAIGTDPIATVNSFHIPPYSSEVIKETLIRQRISGITTGSTTVVDFGNQNGNYFNVGDYVAIQDASPAGINTVHVPVVSVTTSTATLAYNSSSVTGVTVSGDSSLTKSVKISALGQGAGSDVSISEIVLLVSE